MKRLIEISLVVFSMFLILFGCQDTPKQNTLEPDQDLQKSVSTTDAELLAGLTQIAQHVARNSSQLSRSLSNERNNYFGDIFSDSGLPTRFEHAWHGFYDVGIEWSQKSIMNGAPVRVAVDPDRFHKRDTSFPAYYEDVETGKLVVDNIPYELEGNVPFPLAVVTAIDERDLSIELKADPKQNLRKASPGEAVLSTDYLTVKQIKLHHDQDPWSNEEFELNFRVGSGAVNAETDHLFDGITRTDAAGLSKNYPDVNNTSSTYYPDDIHLYPLSSTAISFVAIEDDYIAGGYVAYTGALDDPQTNVYGQEYRHDLGGTIDEDVTRYNEYILNQPNDDDIWFSGMFSGYKSTNLSETEKKMSLDHFDIWLRKHNGIPDPPDAPTNLTINSTQYGYPVYLLWSTSSGATGYKIERNLNGAGFTQIGTTGSAFYTDNDREVNVGGGGAAYTMYRVRAYNAGGDSGYSNTVFSYTIPN